MDGTRRATTESRASGRRKVLVITSGTGVVALAVTGLLTAGLGAGAAAAGTSARVTDSTTSTGTSTDSAATSSRRAPVATSGGS
jgi:hypothetical protein